MKKLENQRGFATIEIICVTLIISVLFAVALPNMARMVDVAIMNYEVKKFCNELYFAGRLDRSARYTNSIFKTSLKSSGIIFSVSDKNRSYNIRRGTYPNQVIIREHKLNGQTEVSYPQNLVSVSFDGFGRPNRDGTYKFTSNLAEPRYVIIDSVKRIRISDTPAK